MEEALDIVRPEPSVSGHSEQPDGSVVNPDAMKEVMARHPDVLFVLDEAYIEYASVRSLADEVVDCGNAVCLLSVSKLGLAGLRLGLPRASRPDSGSDAARMPFPVNALSRLWAP